MTKSIDDITTPPTFTINNSTINDSKSQGAYTECSQIKIKLSKSREPVSYTHLDVYKRQGKNSWIYW